MTNENWKWWVGHEDDRYHTSCDTREEAVSIASEDQDGGYICEAIQSAIHLKDYFRADTSRPGGSPAREWANYPENLAAVIERLQGVGIESRPAARVIEAHDSSSTLFYVDPPYVAETRGNCVGYAHEMSLDQHEQMIDQLLHVEGMVILSGYSHDLYETALSDWFRAERSARADGGRERTEVLWMNFNPRETPAPGGLFQFAAEAAQ